MKVYTLNNMVGPTKAVVTITATSVLYDLYEVVTNKPEVTYTALNVFDDLKMQDDFSDYGLLVRCFDKATDEVRVLGAGHNRLMNILAATMFKPRNTGAGMPYNQGYIDDFLFSLYNSVSLYQRPNLPGRTPPPLILVPNSQKACYKNDIHIMLAVIVPFADSEPKDWVLVLPTKDSDTTIVGADVIGDLPLLRDVRMRESPTMKFAAGPTKDGDVWTFTVNVYNADDSLAMGHAPDVFFETTAGVLLTQRTTADPKTAQAKCLMSVAGLPKDYPIRIKAGFKYFTGLADYSTVKDV